MNTQLTQEAVREIAAGRVAPHTRTASIPMLCADWQALYAENERLTSEINDLYLMIADATGRNVAEYTSPEIARADLERLRSELAAREEAQLCEMCDSTGKNEENEMCAWCDGRGFYGSELAAALPRRTAIQYVGENHTGAIRG